MVSTLTPRLSPTSYRVALWVAIQGRSELFRMARACPLACIEPSGTVRGDLLIRRITNGGAGASLMPEGLRASGLVAVLVAIQHRAVSFQADRRALLVQVGLF